jgi:hypothetical protein
MPLILRYIVLAHTTPSMARLAAPTITAMRRMSQANGPANREVIFYENLSNERGDERAQYRTLFERVNGHYDEKMRYQQRRGGFSPPKRPGKRCGRGKAAPTPQRQCGAACPAMEAPRSPMRAGNTRPYPCPYSDC